MWVSGMALREIEAGIGEEMKIGMNQGKMKRVKREGRHSGEVVKQG